MKKIGRLWRSSPLDDKTQILNLWNVNRNKKKLKQTQTSEKGMKKNYK